MTEITDKEMDEFILLYMSLDSSEACGIIAGLIERLELPMSSLDLFKILVQEAKKVE